MSTTVRLGERPGIDQLRIAEEVDAGASPKFDEISVRIEASSLNAHDYNVASGRLPSKPGRILLTDAAGVVESIGEGVTEFAVGDRVISCFFPHWGDGEQTVADFSRTPGDGVDGYARGRVTIPQRWVTHAPRHLTAAEAAALPTAAVTAWRALVVEGGIKAGDSVLVLGTGGVSIFALQFAKMMGASVIATSSSDAKLERVRALGADHVVNYRKVADWGLKVRDITGGRGVDHVVEVGGPATLAQSIAAGRVGARIALIGVLTGIKGEVPTAALMGRQQRLHGITVGSRRHQDDMVRALEATSMKPIIDRSFTLSALIDAFRYQESGAHIGKISVDIGSA